MIKRYGWARIVVLASLPILAAGCHVRSIASYGSAVTPDQPSTVIKGDPYTAGGVAEGTGGLKTKTTYQSSSPAASWDVVLGDSGRIQHTGGDEAKGRGHFIVDGQPQTNPTPKPHAPATPSP